MKKKSELIIDTLRCSACNKAFDTIRRASTKCPRCGFAYSYTPVDGWLAKAKP